MLKDSITKNADAERQYHKKKIAHGNRYGFNMSE
jgi:hypothetical protein